MGGLNSRIPLKDTDLIRTPHYNERFSLNSTRLIRTPANAKKGHFSLIRQSTDSYGKLTLLIRTLPSVPTVAVLRFAFSDV